MQRRKFIAGMGSLAAAGAAGIGTGAFTSVSASRSVDVAVADDSDALLAIRKDKRDSSVTANAAEYVDAGSTVSIDITETAEGASGINDNATTVIDDLLTIENQGTQTVYVGYTHPASPTGGFALYHEDSDYGNGGQLNINTAPDNDNDGQPDSGTLVELAPGDSLEHIGMFFFGSPDASAISSSPIKFKAADELSDL